MNRSGYCDPDVPQHSFCVGTIPMPTGPDVLCDCECHTKEAP